MLLNQSKDYIIQMFHVYKRYGTKDVMLDITLNVERNEFLFLSGPSGAGKSTLLKLLYLAEPLSRGQIIMDGMNLIRISKKNVHLLRRKIGIIFQDFKLISTRTVFDNVALVLEAKGYPGRLIPKKVRSVLRNVGMGTIMDAFPPSLSGGEQQRVAVARAIVGDPSIILADEPTGSLDPDSAMVILDLLNQFHSKGGTVILATHDRSVIEGTDKRIILLNHGSLLDEIAYSRPFPQSRK
ncbi:cell division protein FtsE [Candidatus Magnetomoraceae bacterium gMMP-15]